ncbi:MAG TPA: hypothetical protein VKU41_26540 [Polyangiaceae bacterium]|nr:hypothetical protein [Polyangiaceae bacterium]
MAVVVERASLARSIGGAMALVWTALALTSRAAWSWSGAATLAAALAAAASLRPIAVAWPRWLNAAPKGAFVTACAAAAAGTSWWFVRQKLRSMPLSIDASVYLLQARALSHLHFGFPVPSPLQSFTDKFTFEGPDGRLYGVFPPGWPLALVPFLWVGAPMAAGPAAAAGLIAAQAYLGDALTRACGGGDHAEAATRTSLLLAVPSYARVVETSDLVSHALIAILASVAVACALGLRGDARRARAAVRGLVLGGCVGWAISARLLDGAVLGIAVAGIVVWTAHGRRALIWVAVGAAPFLLLLVTNQRAATGSWLLPTQAAYFARSDWPVGCHRLGFDGTQGCSVEHGPLVASFGPQGYRVAAALRMVGERAAALGGDLLGFAPLALLAFVPAAFGASGVDALGPAFVVALTLTYALYYNGNAPFYGARHLFPAAPFVWIAAARSTMWTPRWARGWLADGHAFGGALLALLLTAWVCARGPWSTRGADAAEMQSHRSDLRRALDTDGGARGIVRSHDAAETDAAFDTWKDDDERLFVLDDGSGLLDLRRAHPSLPIFLSLPEDRLGKFFSQVMVPPGLQLEIELAWPSFVAPAGLGTRRAQATGASGGTALELFASRVGAKVSFPFEVVSPGIAYLRLDGVTGPDEGDYVVAIDGAPLTAWRGYALAPEPRKGAMLPRVLDPGRHVFTATCVGRDPSSSGYGALLDALVGTVATEGGRGEP